MVDNEQPTAAPEDIAECLITPPVFRLMQRAWSQDPHRRLTLSSIVRELIPTLQPPVPEWEPESPLDNALKEFAEREAHDHRFRIPRAPCRTLSSYAGTVLPGLTRERSGGVADTRAVAAAMRPEIRLPEIVREFLIEAASGGRFPSTLQSDESALPFANLEQFIVAICPATNDPPAPTVPDPDPEATARGYLNHLTQAVRDGLTQQNWYASLALALALPDICGLLEKPKAKSTLRYREWCDRYLTPQYTSVVGAHPGTRTVFLTGKDCHALRCAYLHEGSDELDRARVDKALEGFTIVSPDPDVSLHRNRLNGKLQLQVDKFCTEIVDGVEQWAADVMAKDPAVQERASRVAKIRPPSETFRPPWMQ